MHHNVHILKYFKLSSYVCEKTVLQAVTLYFPNSRKKYTNLEDVNLIDYISQYERYKHVRTQDLWKLMEKKKVLFCLVRELLIGMCMKVTLFQ